MSTARDILQKDKDLREWWDAIAHHDNFAKVLMVARSEMMDDPTMTTEQFNGAKALEKHLRSIATLPVPTREPMTSGLKHDIDLSRKPKDKGPKKDALQ
jgi:hypothetical protein